MEVSEILVNVVFYAFAAVVVIGAFFVAWSRNIVRSAFSLLAVLFGVAALYALMKADFIAAAQILIYVGGILVLIIFAVMLTHRITDVNVSNESTHGPAAFLGSLSLFAVIGLIILSAARWDRIRGPEGRPAKAGAVEVELLQYQADGKTGLAWGGNTVEDRVWLEVRAVRMPGKWEQVRFEAASVGDQKDPVTVTAPLDEDGRARAELKDLLTVGEGGRREEVRMRWKAVFRGPSGETVIEFTRDGAGPHFAVYDGITEPVAWALMGPYLLAFEVVSVLLLAALVGAAFLARKEVRVE